MNTYLSGICDGIPRIARMVGWDLENNPDDILRGSQDTFKFFDRYLHHREDPDPNHARQRKRILLTVSLFKKFGSARHAPDEFAAVQGMAEQADPGITMYVFQDHVEELRKRKILQGRDMLYISPKALHLWLWIEWWKTYGTGSLLRHLVKNFPLRLRKQFFAMFRHARRSDAAGTVVQGLLDDGGPLSDPDSIRGDPGATLFDLLSDADPEAATDYLERVTLDWSDDDFKNFTAGRGSVIRGLGRIVFETELFARGGTLLRRLARNENEARSDNATGLFTGLFSLATGRAALTKTSPADRLSLLSDTLCSDDETVRHLGLESCRSALAVDSAPFGPARDGPGTEPGWEPKTRSDLAGAYKAIMGMMTEKIRTLPDKDKRRCASIISQSSKGLIGMLPSMTDYVADRLCAIKEHADREILLRNVAEILEFKKRALTPEARPRLERLHRELVGGDYHSLLKRYVGMDVMVDPATASQETERAKRIEDLARASDAEKLRPELLWLVTGDAKNGYMFGQELAKKDGGFSLLPLLLDGQRRAGAGGSGIFLGGYLRIVFETDREKWLRCIREMSQDPVLIGSLAETVWRSGITDEIGLLLLDLVRSGRLGAVELGRFSMGGSASMMSRRTVVLWIEHMLQAGGGAARAALRLHHVYFVRRGEDLERHLAFELLTHDVFLSGTQTRHDETTDFYWQQAGLLFIGQFPQQCIDLAGRMLASMGSAGSVARPRSQAMEVLDRISSGSPGRVWDLAARYVLPSDARGRMIMRWMRGTGGRGLLDSVDFQRICDWIDRDPRVRAPYIAGHVRPDLRDGPARDMLVRYGDDEGVQESLLDNFTAGLYGGTSAYCGEKRDAILDYRKTEDDENVTNWIDLCAAELAGEVEREKDPAGILAAPEFRSPA